MSLLISCAADHVSGRGLLLDLLGRSLRVNFLGRDGYGLCLGLGCRELRVVLSFRCLFGLRGLALGCGRLFRAPGDFSFPGLAGCLFICLGRLDFDSLSLTGWRLIASSAAAASFALAAESFSLRLAAPAVAVSLASLALRLSLKAAYSSRMVPRAPRLPELSLPPYMNVEMKKMRNPRIEAATRACNALFFPFVLSSNGVLGARANAFL